MLLRNEFVVKRSKKGIGNLNSALPIIKPLPEPASATLNPLSEYGPPSVYAANSGKSPFNFASSSCS